MALLPTPYRPAFPLPPTQRRQPRPRVWLASALARHALVRMAGGLSIGHGPGAAEDGTAEDLGTETPTTNLTGVQPTPDAHPEDSLHDTRNPLPPAEHPHPDIVQQPADRRGPAQPQDGETPRPQV